MTSPSDFLRLALDPDRLAVLGQAAIGPVGEGFLTRADGLYWRSGGRVEVDR